MRRQSSEPAALQSSIALLQERFRQLQRVKEKREEREQIRAINEQQQQQQQQPKGFVHPDLIHPSRPLSNNSSFFLTEPNYFNEFQSMEASLSLRSWPSVSVLQSSNGCNEGEVDTSLHL